MELGVESCCFFLTNTSYLQHTCQFSQIVGSEPSSFLYKSPMKFSYKYKNYLLSSINFDFDQESSQNYPKNSAFFKFMLWLLLPNWLKQRPKGNKLIFQGSVINSVFHAHIYFSSEKNYMYIRRENNINRKVHSPGTNSTFCPIQRSADLKSNALTSTPLNPI